MCQALVNIGMDPAAKGSVDKARAIAAVVAAMTPGGAGSSSSSSDSRKKGVAQPAVSLLKMMAFEAPQPPIGVQLQILRVMAAAARCHEADAEIVRDFAGSLGTLARLIPELAGAPELEDACPLLLRLLKRNQSVPVCALATCNALRRLLQHPTAWQQTALLRRCCWRRGRGTTGRCP